MAIANADEPRWFNGLGCATSTARTSAGTPGVVRSPAPTTTATSCSATVTRAPHQVRRPAGADARALRRQGRRHRLDARARLRRHRHPRRPRRRRPRRPDRHDARLYVYAAEPARRCPHCLPAGAKRRPGEPRRACRPGPHRPRHARHHVLVRRFGDAAASPAAPRCAADSPRAPGHGFAVTCPLACRLDARADRAAHAAPAPAGTTARPGTPRSYGSHAAPRSSLPGPRQRRVEPPPACRPAGGRPRGRCACGAARSAARP